MSTAQDRAANIKIFQATPPAFAPLLMEVLLQYCAEATVESFGSMVRCCMLLSCCFGVLVPVLRFSILS